MAFKSRDLMMNLSGTAGQTEGEGDCTQCTATHRDDRDGQPCTDCSSTHITEDGGEGDGEHCTDCSSTHASEDKRHALADPALGMLRLQLREALGADAR